MTDPCYFDACILAGPRTRKHPALPWRLEDVLAEMDHCSISGGLVRSTTTISYDLLSENLRLCRQLSGHDHLFPVWNAMPAATGEFPETTALHGLMREHDIRALTLNPRTNGWDWEADHSQELLSLIEAEQILTLLPRQEFGGWRELDLFLERHPRLPLLLMGATWSEQRYLLPLLTKHRNLHITFDHFQIHYGLEHLVAQGQVDQLLYGSNAPAMSMGAHRAYVDYADIPPAAREQIAGGNLSRLLKGQRPPRVRLNGDEDELMRAARAGEPLPVPVIDMHMHILDDGLDCAGGAYRMERGGPSGVFPLLERLGCVGGGFMSWNGTVGVDCVAGNATVAGVMDVAPSGYWALASIDPTHYSQEEMERMIPQMHADPRFIGMKPYVHYGVEYNHPSYDIWWEYGNARSYYALMHRTRNDYREIDILAGKYPDVRWVVAHCGASYEVADGVIECMNKHPNVYAEITLTPVTLGVIDYIVEHAGPDRILYGSDLPMRDPRQQLGWAVYSRLSLENKVKLLCTNALRVLAPCWARLPAHHRPKVASRYWPEGIDLG